MGFKGRKKKKYQEAEKFIEKIKEIQEEAKAVLGKVQEKMKKYANRKRTKVDDYKVEDLVMLSTKDLKYQMVKKRTKKLTERFVSSYKIKKIILSNAVELELLVREPNSMLELSQPLFVQHLTKRTQWSPY